MLRAAAPVISVVEARPRTAPRPPRYQRRVTGLDWLGRLGQLEAPEIRAGERYGRDYRFATMDSGAMLRSCLDMEGRGGGGVGGGLPSVSDCSSMIITAREELELAREALGNHEGMVLTCNLVCGQFFTPRELAPAQREAEQIVNALRVALQLLVRHYGGLAKSNLEARPHV